MLSPMDMETTLNKTSQQHEGLTFLLMPLIGRLTCHVRHQMSHVFKAFDYDLTPETAGALMIIKHFDGLPQKMLADILGKDKASITRLLNNLVQHQLVERIQDQNDRRIIRAHLTQKGQKTFVAISPQLKMISNTILQGISEQDFNTLIRILSSMMDNLTCNKTTPKQK